MKKHTTYAAGQWFVVPLLKGGYAVGILVRGGPKAGGGLGYFFGPGLDGIPEPSITLSLQPEDAILVAWFGDLGIRQGRWPLIASSRPFSPEDWPVPNFKRIDALVPSKGWLVEYDQQAQGFDAVVRETLHEASELQDLPQDGVFGAGAVAKVLTGLLQSP